MILRILQGLISFAFVLFIFTGCASDRYLSANEIGLGKSVSQLQRLGWDVGPATAVEKLEQDNSSSKIYSGQDWGKFKSILRPGDELREVRGNNQAGVAIFRQDIFVEAFLPMVALIMMQLPPNNSFKPNPHRGGA